MSDDTTRPEDEKLQQSLLFCPPSGPPLPVLLLGRRSHPRLCLKVNNMMYARHQTLPPSRPSYLLLPLLLGSVRTPPRAPSADGRKRRLGIAPPEGGRDPATDARGKGDDGSFSPPSSSSWPCDAQTRPSPARRTDREAAFLLPRPTPPHLPMARLLPLFLRPRVLGVCILPLRYDPPPPRPRVKRVLGEARVVGVVVVVVRGRGGGEEEFFED